MKKRYDEEIAERILALISDGKTLRGACEQLDLPRRTVRDWTVTIPTFGAAMQEARRQQLEVIADEIITISDEVEGCQDNAVVQAARLRCDNRRWLLSKLYPERYGERVAISGTDGRDLLPANPEAAIPRLLQVLAVLLPNSNNSELYELARTMASKLKAVEGPKGNGEATD
jgi:hypothetical protein